MSEDEDDSEITDDCEIDIYVIDSEGNPVTYEEVAVYWGFWYGHSRNYTDDEGHVSFWIPNDEITGRASSVEFYVKNVKYEYDVDCGYSFTVNIDDED